MTANHHQDRFVRLLEPHRRILYKVATVYCSRREDRGDLIQEIVIELWRAFERFDERASFATWMHRIAVNVSISFYRGESRRIRDALPIEDFALDLAGADNIMDGISEDLLALQQLMAKLDEIDRALILLFLEGYAHDEIATTLGISPSNVATRIQRIKEKLRREHAASEAKL